MPALSMASPPGSGDRLGPFWFIRNGSGVVRLLAHAIALADAEPYSDRLTCPRGYAELWTAWRRGRPKSPMPELAPVIATDEYEDWPRRRILFDRPTDHFIVYADRQRLTPPYLAAIRALPASDADRGAPRPRIIAARTG